MNLSGPAAEVAQNGVGKLAVHLDVLLAGNRVARAAVRRAGVAELAKEVGQEVRQDFLFLEGVGLAGRQQVGPMLQLGPTEELLRPGRASVIDMTGIIPELQAMIVSRLLTDIFEARKRRLISPGMVVVEEAHNYIPERGTGNAASTSIIRTIAAEGRKFGLGLMVISQRPARVNKNVISQCQHPDHHARHQPERPQGSEQGPGGHDGRIGRGDQEAACGSGHDREQRDRAAHNREYPAQEIQARWREHPDRGQGESGRGCAPQGGERPGKRPGAPTGAGAAPARKLAAEKNTGRGLLRKVLGPKRA